MEEEQLQLILQNIDKALDEGAEPIAAFDADGTLWDTDLGENFFDYQIHNKCIQLPESPWDFYKNMKKEDPRKAYLWLAQINKGKNLDEVHHWAKSAIQEKGKTPLFDHQIEIINHLLARRVDVYIVTASIKWAIDPASALFGLPDSQVIGVTTQVTKDGLITDIQGGPITYREGKVEALLEKTGGKKPFFCSGNSPGDIYLLEAATHIPFVNSATRSDDPIYESEMEMIEIAKKRGWTHYRQELF